jgi:phospholipid-binding lipoprotein MlaA
MFSLLHPGKNRVLAFAGLLISSALLTTGCASTEIRDPTSPTRADGTPWADPYEGFNRSMYGFNMGLDRYLLKPVANSYQYITPDFMETGVSNFFTNLKGINVVLNDVLQGKLEQSAEDTGRFLTNTTLGVAGLFDVASGLGLRNNVEDFGQTLAVWGVDQGAYLVLPVLGPTTVRDGGGSILDRAANPGTYVPGTGILEGINDRANAEGALNFIDEAALDPYVFTRESFLQYRTNLINDGKSDSSSYDLDLDAALEDSQPTTDGQKSGKPTSSKPKATNSSVGSKLTTPANSGASTSQAFNDMSKSFTHAEQEFEQASEKMDKLAEKKRRRHR